MDFLKVQTFVSTETYTFINIELSSSLVACHAPVLLSSPLHANFSPLSSIIPSSHLFFYLYFNPLSFLFSLSLLICQVTCLKLSAFFCFTAGGAVIKACEWETWVALSHALCLPHGNSLQSSPTPPTHHSALFPDFISLFFI